MLTDELVYKNDFEWFLTFIFCNQKNDDYIVPGKTINIYLLKKSLVRC